MSSHCDSHVAWTGAGASAIQALKTGNVMWNLIRLQKNTVASIEKPTRADCVRVGTHQSQTHTQIWPHRNTQTHFKSCVFESMKHLLLACSSWNTVCTRQKTSTDRNRLKRARPPAAVGLRCDLLLHKLRYTTQQCCHSPQGASYQSPRWLVRALINLQRSNVFPTELILLGWVSAIIHYDGTNSARMSENSPCETRRIQGVTIVLRSTTQTWKWR